MKTILTLLLAGLQIASVSVHAANDVQMLPTRTKLDGSKSREKGNTTVVQNEIAYDVKVTSKSFKELQNITIKYNIYYENAQFGSKAEPEVKMAKGSHALPSLLTNKPVEFTTESVKLEKASLDGNWYFSNGASGSARDKVVGLWFKAFDAEGNLVGEYANPSSVKTKRTFQE